MAWQLLRRRGPPALPLARLPRAPSARRSALRRCAWLGTSLLLALRVDSVLVRDQSGDGEVVEVTNIRREEIDPDRFWDKTAGKPTQFWTGNYTELSIISCKRCSDMLFDWVDMKQSLIAWLKEYVSGSTLLKQLHWEKIRPMQHALTNIIAFHTTATNRDCFLGMLSVRLFYVLLNRPSYWYKQIVELNNFGIDWHYFAYKFRWSHMVESGWGSVVWPVVFVLSSHFRSSYPELDWIDCERVPGAEHISADSELTLLASAEELSYLAELVTKADEQELRRCPIAYASIALRISLTIDSVKTSLHFLDVAQSMVAMYREANDFTFVNLLNNRWRIWNTMHLAVEKAAHDLGSDRPQTCQLLWCPEGGTPNPLKCKCEQTFPREHPNVTACIFMVDTRRLSSLRNITSVLNAKFWTLTYGLNRLYAEEFGYEIEYVRPDNETHFPDRKVGWGKVKVVIDKLREYGPERCEYGVSIDTDAFFRSSEPLASVIFGYGLNEDKLVMFSQEYHVEDRPKNTYANGGFFIVRNSPEGVGILEEWYNVPEDYPEMAHLKKENPQGLNLCWDLKMHPKHKDSVVLAPSHLFTAPRGWWIRHNWFKDLRFEQEMQDILLQKLQRKYGCIVCQNVFDWDDSTNDDPGWR